MFQISLFYKVSHFGKNTIDRGIEKLNWYVIGPKGRYIHGINHSKFRYRGVF